ncbi:ATPase with signal peptide [Cryptosporidium ubiquitum]|uniref:ATPase with signal peptide n=1 Tax=Cryptosporidium ubiquitum TaxID=857276 RepID=A0A1J4MIW3_9CRYT|nr:ATPase with signal peptide [Cryptosporidium ubiquitum]OII74134.1 ATPase with signal peptide [Cryptosporidium ubiquitum]
MSISRVHVTRCFSFFLLFSLAIFFLVHVVLTKNPNSSNKLEINNSSIGSSYEKQNIGSIHTNRGSIKLDSTSSDPNKIHLDTNLKNKLTRAIQKSFVKFQKGNLSENDIDIEELIFDIAKLALDGNGNQIFPSLELIDFFQKIIETSKYNTVTTLDFILAFISKDDFETNISHDMKRLKKFTEYLSYLLKYNNENGLNKMFNFSKETLSLIKTNIYSTIWKMEELIKKDKIMEYENENLHGKTIYSSQPVIGEINNEINSNLPRAVFSYKLVKQTIIEILDTNMNKVYSKLKLIYGKITYAGSERKNKVLSLNLLYSIYLSVIIINDLYDQGLSSNVLSPGFIFIVLMRDSIDNLPNDWEKRLIDNNINYGINELDVKIQDIKYSHPESTTSEDGMQNECNISVLRSNVKAVFSNYGIDHYKFINEALKKYKTLFNQSPNRQFNSKMWFYGFSFHENDFNNQFNKKWFFDINKLVIENGVTKAIDFMDEYYLLEISLSGNGLSSAIIVGESKIMKRSLIEYLAHRIINGISSIDLKGYRIINIDFDSLLESCKSAKRTLTEQIKIKFNDLLGTYDGKVIIFTDHLFSSFETPTGSKRLYDVIKHYIIRGNLKVIAALNNENYDILVEKEAEVKSIFRKIKMKELNGIVSELFISGLRYQLELSTGIFINNNVIHTSVLMCNKYIENCILPDDAIELINYAIRIAKNEQFLEIPSEIHGIEDFISHSRTGLQVSKIRDYETNSIISTNRSLLMQVLKMHLKMKNTMISLALKIKPYLFKFRYLKTQLYFMFTYFDYPITCVNKPLEDEFKILKDREKIIPNFSDELSVAQLTSIYRSNLLKYKQNKNKSYDESINDEVSAITESQLDPKFFDDIHPIIKDKQKEVADMKSLILEMSFNYNSIYLPLGMGEIDASHIAFIISERYGKNISKLLNEIEYRKLPERIKDQMSGILSKYIIGQKSAIDYVSFHLGVELSRDNNKNVPKCLLFVGPPGSGKKTFALALQTTLMDISLLSNDFSYDITMYSNFKTLNSSDFADEDAAKRLLGDNPTTGIIPEELRQSGKTLFLFDHIEGMHPDVIRLILDILRNKNNINHKIGYLGLSTFILTTEVGSNFILDDPDKVDTVKLIIKVVRKHRETPSGDLVRAIQNIVLFRPFTKEEVLKILEINFVEYSAFIKKNYNVTLAQPSQSVLNKIVDIKYSPELGYKPILDYFEDMKERIMQLIKEGILKPYMTFKVTIRNDAPAEDSKELRIDFNIVKRSNNSR